MMSYPYICSCLSASCVGALGTPGEGSLPAVVEEEGLIKTRLLPPGPGNPRNSEGAFGQLKDGRVLFVYTHFTGGGGDNATAHLAGRISSDGGRTWSHDDVVILANEGEMNVMSVSLLRLHSGAIALFYLRKNSEHDCHLYMRLSTDEACSWGEPVLCTPGPGYYVVNNDRVIQLQSGRLVVPASLHTREGVSGFAPGVAMCYLSDDGGKTWRRSETLLPAPEGSRSGLQEPGIVELRDGRVMMLCRTDQGCQMRSWSSDGGETWTAPERTELLSPVSPATVKRIPKTGDLLLVWNDHRDIDPALQGKRTPLRAALSRDEGVSWENTKSIEEDPEGWFCYTAMEFVGDQVLLAYCATATGLPHLSRTQITRFPVEWLYIPRP